MVARERRELTNRLETLLAHLPTWLTHPEQRGRSWAAAIREQRRSIEDLLQDNPSNRDTLDRQIDRACGFARLLAVRETDLDESCFPVPCRFTPEEILGVGFYPDR